LENRQKDLRDWRKFKKDALSATTPQEIQISSPREYAITERTINGEVAACVLWIAEWSTALVKQTEGINVRIREFARYLLLGFARTINRFMISDGIFAPSMRRGLLPFVFVIGEQGPNPPIHANSNDGRPFTLF
jgi:hypothetical protein